MEHDPSLDELPIFTFKKTCVFHKLNNSQCIVSTCIYIVSYRVMFVPQDTIDDLYKTHMYMYINTYIYKYIYIYTATIQMSHYRYYRQILVLQMSPFIQNKRLYIQLNMYNKLNMYNIYCIIEYVHKYIYIRIYIYIHTYENISFIVRDTLHIRTKIR